MLDKNDPRITAFALNELSGDEHQELAAAIAKSPELQQLVQEIQATANLMQDSFQVEPSHELTDEQKSTIEQEAKSPAATPVRPVAKPMAKPMPNQEGSRFLWIAGGVVAVAACLLMALAWQVPVNNANNEVAKFDASSEISERESNAKKSYSKKKRGYDQSDEINEADMAKMMQGLGDDAALANPAIPDDDATMAVEESIAPVQKSAPDESGMMGGAPRQTNTSGGGRVRTKRDAASMGGMGGGGGMMGGMGGDDGGGGMSSMMGGGSPGPGGPGGPGGDSPAGASGGGAGAEMSSMMQMMGGAPAADRNQAGARTPAKNPGRPSTRPGGMPTGRPGNGQPASFDGKSQNAGGQGNSQQGQAQQGAEAGGEEADPRDNSNSGQGKSDALEAEMEGGDGDEGQSGEGQSEREKKSAQSGQKSDEAASGAEGKEKADKDKSKSKDNRKTGTWKRAKSLPNNSRLMIGTRDELPLKGVQMNVQVDGFRARVLLDCYYYNDRNRQLEGNFKLRLPNEASLYYVAFGQTSFEYRPMVDQLTSRGFLTPEILRATGTGPKDILKARQGTWANVKEARMVPKAKAALAYTETVRRRVDPALVEWSGAGIFQARVFPLMPKKLHRIVIGYDVNLRQEGNQLKYELPLPANAPEVTVDLSLAAMPGVNVKVAPEVRPFTASGRAFFHYQNPKTDRIEVALEGANHAAIVGKDAEKEAFFATRLTPELPAGEQLAGSKRAIFMVDTSLSSQPAKFNVWLSLLESILEKNRGPLEEFAVVFFDVQSHWWKPEYTKNTTENVEELIQYCQSLSLEGATDLQQALNRAVKPGWDPSWQKKKKDTIRPDLFLLSDGAVTWGEDQLFLIGKTLQEGTGGTLFAYKTGYTGTSISTLEHLARESGGAVFTVINEQSVPQVATAHRRRPWQLLDVAVTGGSDLLLAGRVRSIYPGESLHLVGRGEPSGEVVLRVRRGDEQKEIRLPLTQIIRSDLAARAFGQVAVGQLESIALGIEDIASAYARHFRVTGETCSLLMLESEADYRRFNIKPEADNLVVTTTSAEELMTNKLDELHQMLTDPKENVLAWLERLESSQAVRLNLPAALKVLVKNLPKESFDVAIPELECRAHTKSDIPGNFVRRLAAKPMDPDYERVTLEAERRRQVFSAADGVKALSSLVESNPGDHVIARDVAFSAIEWDLGGQAYPLLKRVVKARPFEPQTYQAIAQCLTSLGNADLAVVYYEIVLNGVWNQRYRDIHRICAVEYADLLRQIQAGEIESRLKKYANVRLRNVIARAAVNDPDLVVTMMWNTDRTDVDLHVQEPSGEECFYKNRKTRAGGTITRDVTEGYGPEMYIRNRAERGQYIIKANYYGEDANRTGARTKVYVTVYENFGKKTQRKSKHTVMLSRGKEKRNIATIKFDKPE